MRRIFVFITLCLQFQICQAKGGHCAAGHSCGGHAYASTHHSQHDTDAFAELRKSIYTGFVVYGSDTLQGMVICSGNAIGVRVQGADSTISYPVTDTHLRFASITGKGRPLELVRLQDNKLYRVLHKGKLNVYDTYFSFDYNSKEFFNAASWVSYPGYGHSLNTFWTTSVKKKLVLRMNEAYGLTLSIKDYKKKELLAYLSTLN